MGLAPLDRLDAMPNPTRTFFNRPSQSSATSFDVEARAFTTPVTSYGGASGNNDDDGRMDASSTVVTPLEPDFDRERRSHHSAPIVHSLS